jgi:uncharacterized membrane protein
MVMVMVVGLIILGCLLVAVCLVVLTFTGVDIRRLGGTLLAEFGAKADRNYEKLSDTNEITRRVEAKVDTLLTRVVPMEPEE